MGSTGKVGFVQEGTLIPPEGGRKTVGDEEVEEDLASYLHLVISIYSFP